MKCTELNPAGNFDHWDLDKMEELKKLDFDKTSQMELLYENNNVKVSEISLLPSERFPFHRFPLPRVWSCDEGGLLLRRYGSGQIKLVIVEKGDTFYEDMRDGDLIHDLENIDQNEILLKVVELKNPI